MTSSPAFHSVVFAGEFRHVLDGKHRVTVPSSWRLEDSDPGYFLLPAPTNDHVVAFPPAEFEKVGQQVSQNPAIPARDQRIFVRQFFSKAQQGELDRQGRLLIPENLRRIAQLDSEVLLIGGGTRFEIWSPAQWDRVTKEEQLTYQQVANIIGLY